MPTLGVGRWTLLRERVKPIALAGHSLGELSALAAAGGAFHSPQMRHAVGPFSEALQEVQIRDAAIPILSCATARPFREPVHELAQALVRPVRWRETMIALAGAGASTFVDVGPAATLARLTPYWGRASKRA